MASEFDQYVGSYKEIINQRTAITGESFEYFIRLRVGLLAEAIAGEPPPARILDFGCGIGETERALGERFPQAGIDAVDSSSASIDAARALGLPRVDFHFSAGVKLPFDDHRFDVIYSNGTLHHIDHTEHPALLAEMARVLRPGGHLFIFENNPLNPLTVRNMRNNPFDAGTKMLFPWYLRRLEAGAGLRARAPRFYVFFPKQLKRLRWSEKHLGRVPVGAQYYVWGTKVR
jgi:ubiquinone/menaquinone biosynthesis C-methylase UbiE